MPPVGIRGAITVCPALVAEIRSDTGNPAPLQCKMERCVTNGALLGWLIDPCLRQVHVHRPGIEPELLEDPETVGGEGVLPGFTLEVRRRIFVLHQPAQE